MAAVGIFAIGMVAAIAMFAPVAKSVASSSDAETAARSADAVRSRVQSLGFDATSALIQDAATVSKNDADPSYNPNDGAKHPKVIFATATGEVGLYNAAAATKTWYVRDYSGANPPAAVMRVMTDAEKFFEIDLIADPARTTDVLLSYTIRVRWPAFLRTSPSSAVQNGQNLAGGAVPFDQGKRQALYFSGSLLK